LNFACESCHHRYALPDDKVRGKSVRVRCRHCGHLTAVSAPAEELVAPPPPRGEWYVMIRGAQAGPYDLPGLAERVAAGDASAQSFVWRKGLAQWARAAEVPHLASLFATAPGPPAPPLAELFSDADEATSPEASIVPAPNEKERPAPAPRAEPMPKAAPADPFAALGELDPDKLPPPGESTMFFINQAGVNKRNPPWKIAAFIGGGAGAVALVLFLLSSLNVVPLTIRRTDGEGNAVDQSVFSAEGVSGLGDLLMGKKKDRQEPALAPTRKATRPGTVGSVHPAGGQQTPPAPAARPSSEELAALYSDSTRVDKGPRVRRNEEVRAPSSSTGGLSPEELHKVVSGSQSAFQNCIEQELRKNPNLKLPRFYIRATVGNSGTVTGVSIDRREVDGTPLGECLKTRARRMTFAQFAGDELVVEIPLIVGVAL
jgi:predicted Zn finger-like uncharacterized protein